MPLVAVLLSISGSSILSMGARLLPSQHIYRRAWHSHAIAGAEETERLGIPMTGSLVAAGEVRGELSWLTRRGTTCSIECLKGGNHTRLKTW